MEKLNINMFPESSSLANYEKARLSYISEYTVYEPGYSTGFLSYRDGRNVPRPDVGEIKWKEMYPDGYESWAGERQTLSAHGTQRVIDKINEIIDSLTPTNS